MRSTFDPLPLVYVPHEIVSEGPARVAFANVTYFRAYMERKARAISAEAHAALLRQWPELINGILLNTTREFCRALRSGLPLNLN